MWLCLNNGFFSIVKNYKEDNLMVRARVKDHLSHYFPNKEITETPKNDYRFRIFLTKEEFARWLVTVVDELDYHNFKSSVRDNELHHFYNNVWYLGLESLNKKHHSKNTKPYYFDRYLEPLEDNLDNHFNNMVYFNKDFNWINK